MTIAAPAMSGLHTLRRHLGSSTVQLLCLAFWLNVACLMSAQDLRAQGRGPAGDWEYYGGNVFGQRYSPLDQIHRDNVQHLEVAWTYRTGELGEGFDRARKLAFEATPLHAFGFLYLSTPTNIIIALEPATGRERWRYDPRIDRTRPYHEATSRGVSIWADTAVAAPSICDRRVLSGTLDARLVAVDAKNGKPCADFGIGGVVDLTQGMRIRDPQAYLITSPPAIYQDLVIVGSAIGDNRAVDVERGIVRAFDVRTGVLRWSFDPLPDTPSHPAAGDWRADQSVRTGAANAWSIMSVDPERGLLFVPTSSASPDFFGGERLGDNRFANSLLALEASTGKLVWHRQLVHHDLWDYDLAAQPTLIDLEKDGVTIPAVIQATKTGMLFVFHRETGEPVYPVEERPVPQSHVPEERTSPTQPFSSLPPLVDHRPLKAENAWGLTFWDRGKCREMLETYRNEGIFTPPDPRGTVLSPGYVGGVNWGGIAMDVRRQRVFAAVNHMPMAVTLIPPEVVGDARRSGRYPVSEFAYQRGTPYAMRREPLLSPWKLPCSPPPWGTLASVDLQTSRIVWQVPLGTTEGTAPWFFPTLDWGMPHMGGPIATAGDLVFVGAAMDSYIRAFDFESGRELWKHRLPAGGQATPMTYQAGGRQYVVIAAGGHGGLGTPRGDYVIAFALPRRD